MDDPPHALIDTAADHHHLAARNAGIAVIYFPFLANNEVPGVDPLKAEFMSTWNFVYTPEEIDSVVALARANYREGRERTKRTIRAVWERKRARRWEREEEEREFERRVRVRRGCGDTGYWDNFS
ncbi:hypothetical protein LTR91_008591 [Friedmanniomyces endolithicus]|nr:hypothetical protein LTR91_008591 [Friedmanniomyces endolithicus]